MQVVTGSFSQTAFAQDRVRRKDTEKQRAAFAKVRAAERDYAAQLRKIARHIGDLVASVHPLDDAAIAQIVETLKKYAEILRPWAQSTARRMIAETARRDEIAWNNYAEFMGVELHRALQHAPLGTVVRKLQDDQVNLITSLPLQAAQRVQEIARGTLYTGERAAGLRDEILKTGAVTRTRATLIARTETAKASSLLTQARAEHIGSEGYIWRTVKDRDVRKSHRKMEGKFVRWDTPPQVDPGKYYHAGQSPNCRCFAEPVLPDM